MQKRFAEPQAERNDSQNQGDFSEQASGHNSSPMHFRVIHLRLRWFTRE